MVKGTDLELSVWTNSKDIIQIPDGQLNDIFGNIRQEGFE